MKRIALLLALALTATACAKQDTDLLQGYGEADYLYLASQEAGVVGELFVTEGQSVEAGAPVFRLDGDRIGYAVQSAAANRSALVEAVQVAQADARLAERNFARSNELFERGFLSRARLDTDRAQRDAADARVDQAQRQLSAAGAETGLAQTRLGDLQGAAPSAGTIERIFHRPGEVVAAGAPIVALLPPENVKVRFFIPQDMLARARVGAAVTITCDGCEAPIAGRISFVAEEPQFTPPIIYSTEQREKLVFLVEARFSAPSRVRPGIPVDVRIVE